MDELLMTEQNDEILSAYNDRYSESTEEWRRIGSIGKAKNISEVIKNLSFENVIEIGAGDGNILKLLSEKNIGSNLTAVEVSDSAIQQIQKKNIKNLTNILKYDGYVLPFRNREFDLAICSHVLEHVEYPRKLLREIKRISKYQVFEIPVDYSRNVDKKVKHFLSYGHINIFNPPLFRFLLKSEGFDIVNEKSSLYENIVFRFMYRTNNLKYVTILIKKILWKLFPIMMKIKPNTYTTLTKDNGQNLRIFE
jgi:ubiquinone/menaquinone biosynthesis C-methylase UbiE